MAWNKRWSNRRVLPFQGIDTGKVRGVNPLTALTSVGKMVAGVRQSLALLRNFQPDVCFVTGGYVCTPVALACRLRGVPVLIYLPDMKPGWAIRLLSLLAQRVAVSFPEVAAYFGGEAPQGKAVVTGYPVRPELVCAAGGGLLDAQAHAQNRATVRRQLADRLQRPFGNLEKDGQMLPLVLVWGGSQGSRNINQIDLERFAPTVAARPHLACRGPSGLGAHADVVATASARAGTGSTLSSGCLSTRRDGARPWSPPI